MYQCKQCAERSYKYWVVLKGLGIANISHGQIDLDSGRLIRVVGVDQSEGILEREFCCRHNTFINLLSTWTALCVIDLNNPGAPQSNANLFFVIRFTYFVH